MTELTIVHGVPTAALAPAGRRPGADRGDPQLHTHVLPTEAPGNIGIWECEPGGWPVENRTDTEVAYILAGSGTILDESTGVVHDLTPGTFLVLPPGWSGRWEVVETIRKAYAIY